MFHRRNHTSTTRSTHPTFWTRLKGPTARTRTYKTEETTTPRTTTRRAPPATSGFGQRRNHHRNGYGNTTTGTTGPMTGTHHHRRRPSFGDKVSGAMLKLKGSLTGRPGVKAAGTRRMRGTDGRGSHAVY